MKLDPSFTAVYGKAKQGKSTDTIFAFPEALFIAAPGALNPAASVVGVEPKYVVDADFIDEVTELVRRYGKKVRAIVVDDFSIIADQTMRREETRRKGWRLWSALRNLLLDVRGAARDAGCHVIFSCHERPPGLAKGIARLGGPKLPGQMPEDFPALADLVLRVRYDLTRVAWPYVYTAGPDANWVVGDRYNVVQHAAPMNLGEILRAAGHEIPRPAGLEWIEKGVEGLAEVLIPYDNPVDERGVIKAAAEKLSGANRHPRHIAWLLRDTIDRAALHRRRSMGSVLAPWLNPQPMGFGALGANGDGIGIGANGGQGGTVPHQLTAGEQAGTDDESENEEE